MGFMSDRFLKANIPAIKKESVAKDLQQVLAEGGISLEKSIRGEIIEVTLAPNESKIISHGLKAIPQYRLILRQTGNAVITDVDEHWNKKTIGLKNNSGTDTVVLTIKLLPG
jgi:hypothetical protein